MINWKVRFNKNNAQFLIRFVAALLIPILAYMGIRAQDITSWPMLWNLFLTFISNPYLLVLTMVNAINVVPDPTTATLWDSRQAMRYLEPKNDKDYL